MLFPSSSICGIGLNKPPKRSGPWIEIKQVTYQWDGGPAHHFASSASRDDGAVSRNKLRNGQQKDCAFMLFNSNHRFTGGVTAGWKSSRACRSACRLLEV